MIYLTGDAGKPRMLYHSFSLIQNNTKQQDDSIFIYYFNKLGNRKDREEK